MIGLLQKDPFRLKKRSISDKLLQKDHYRHKKGQYKFLTSTERSMPS